MNSIMLLLIDQHTIYNIKQLRWHALDMYNVIIYDCSMYNVMRNNNYITIWGYYTHMNNPLVGIVIITEYTTNELVYTADSLQNASTTSSQLHYCN